MKIEFAIVDANMLTCMGLHRLLSEMMPMVCITTFRSYEELIINEPERFVHFFVSSGIYFEHSQYFRSNPHRSIVLVHGDSFPSVPGLLTLNVCQDEVSLTKSLLYLKKMGDAHHAAHHSVHADVHPAHQTETHPAGHPAHLSASVSVPPSTAQQPQLSPREVEVAVLLAKGYINKEIADVLHISLSTVITHRKSIMAKLQARSLADVVLYVVMQGIVTVEAL